MAYYTYIYAKVDREHYPKVTSYTYSAILAGRSLGGVTAQLMNSFEVMNLLQLNYFSLACVSVALTFSLFLPRVKQSIYFHRDIVTTNTVVAAENVEEGNSSSEPDTETVATAQRKTTFRQKLQDSKRYMLNDLKSAYGNSYVLKWSIWWAVATAGHLQVLNFNQALWETIVTENGSGSQEYNGAVEAGHTLISNYNAKHWT